MSPAATATARTLAEFGLPDPVLVLTIGCSGSGKSTLVRAFARDDVLSADVLRGLLTGSRADQSVNGDAWALLHLVLERRMVLRRSTVVDATSATAADRAELVRLAGECGVPVAAIVADTALPVALARNALRDGALRVPDDVVREQFEQIARSLPGLSAEGIEYVLPVSSLPLLTTLLRRRAERDAGVEALAREARAVFGAGLAALITWDGPGSGGAVHGRLAAGTESMELRYRGGGDAGQDGFQTIAVCETGCSGPAWVNVRSAADLLDVAAGWFGDEALCDTCHGT
ncbi:AAA family ATPase [Kitasatospora sp. NPDC059088]|uniref:AAA family ATPase n=1 Tax=Kitasatospora sp. NPDC059088 TaxID=3346722 RepID=UPI00367E868A